MANEIALSSYVYEESLCKQKYEKYGGLMSQEESPEVSRSSEFFTGSISGLNITSHHQNKQKLDRSLEICFHRFYFHDLFFKILYKSS